MNILAIDASTKSSGIAIFKDKEFMGKGCITASSTDLFKRIHKMVDKIDEIIAQAAIEEVVMEEVIPDHSKNTNTFKALMYLQAAIVIMVHDKYPNISLELVYPGSWRSTCGIRTGRGVQRESVKQADIRFANQTYGLNLVSDDEADAICIGHAHLYPKAVGSSDLNWE